LGWRKEAQGLRELEGSKIMGDPKPFIKCTGDLEDDFHRAARMAIEASNALLDMCIQHCSCPGLKDVNGNSFLHHGFVSANEDAFAILESHGRIKFLKLLKKWKVMKS